jgi:hypothetical protein
MARSRYRTDRRWGRRAITKAVSEVTPSAAPPARIGVVARTLNLPAVDWMLKWLLARPRVLQLVDVLLGMAIVGLALRSLLLSARPLVPTGAGAASTQTIATAILPPTGSEAQAAIDLVAAYNQASIAAAVLNRADALAAYLTTDGSAWADAQAEYQRRASTGETHHPTLSRWGILRVAIDADTAIVETQEQWDDLTSVDGAVVSSKRGLLTQNVYYLRRAPSTERWLITTITTTNVIG